MILFRSFIYHSQKCFKGLFRNSLIEGLAMVFWEKNWKFKNPHMLKHRGLWNYLSPSMWVSNISWPLLRLSLNIQTKNSPVLWRRARLAASPSGTADGFKWALEKWSERVRRAWADHFSRDYHKGCRYKMQWIAAMLIFCDQKTMVSRFFTITEF